MDERAKQVGNFLKDALQDGARKSVRNHGEDQQRRGFTSAAGIALRLTEQKIDAYKKQMKGPGLNKSDQAICIQLEELKLEIEAECDRFWQGSGVDWRPLKPVVKGVVRTTEDPQS